MTPRPLVIIESPFSGDHAANSAYAKRALLDSISRGEAPFASHLLYPQVLDDTDPEDRSLGMSLGFLWLRHAVACMVYVDRGISEGMKLGIHHATEAGLLIVERRLDRGRLS